MPRAGGGDTRCTGADPNVSIREQVLHFDCAGTRLMGILSRPEQQRSKVGVVIVVGGPQYRVGSHRQFVLLARRLAERGYSVLRFDYRGMGDSLGETQPFDDVDTDIGAATEALLAACAEIKTVCLWGLCDAASAAMMYAPTDTRVAGLVLLNPWIRSEATIARTYLRHYYIERLLSRAFWSKLLAGAFSPTESVRSLFGMFSNAMRAPDKGAAAAGRTAPFQERMLHGAERFRGSVLLMLSGRDLTAQEFVSVTNGNPRWRRALHPNRLERWELPEADHTFSSREWRAAVEQKTIDWLDKIVAPNA